ncbi:MAG: hypothetical protein RRC07_05165 [Anaerolineae bacterium]|nr:hypothetical protein [Anaerolineae bacterium]
MTIVVGIFLVLHGLVHLLYFGQSWRLFELQPGMVWPDGSWAFTRLLGDGGTRWLASAACTVAATTFAGGGAGLLLQQPWWRPVVVGAAVFSSVVYLLLWDGRLQSLDDKGGVGLLINLAIVAVVLVLRWPQFDV